MTNIEITVSILKSFLKQELIDSDTSTLVTVMNTVGLQVPLTDIGVMVDMFKDSLVVNNTITDLDVREERRLAYDHFLKLCFKVAEKTDVRALKEEVWEVLNTLKSNDLFEFITYPDGSNLVELVLIVWSVYAQEIFGAVNLELGIVKEKISQG